MRISELIKWLEEIKEKEGNIEVIKPAGNGPFDDGSEQEVRPEVHATLSPYNVVVIL